MMTAQVVRQPDWLCETLGMAVGRPTLLIGDGGAGKTIAAQSLALAMVNTVPALGGLRCAPGGVVWLSWEQSHDAGIRLCQRVMDGAGITPSPLAQYRGHFFPAFRLNDSGALSKLVRLVGGYSLCVIDSLSAAIQSQDPNYLNGPGARAVLDTLNEVSALTACSFLVLHHVGKSKGKRSMLGSAGLANACDAVLHLEARSGDEGTRVITSQKSSQGHGLPSGGYVFHYEFPGQRGVGPIRIVKGERTADVIQLAAHQRSRVPATVSTVRVGNQREPRREPLDRVRELHARGMKSAAIAKEIGKRKQWVLDVLAGRFPVPGSPNNPSHGNREP